MTLSQSRVVPSGRRAVSRFGAGATATTLLLDRAREETGGGGHGDSRNRKANLGGAFKDS
jgi:hypothetical protein